MRYRKRIQIAPGLRLNVSKSGVSVSAGVPGLSVTAGRRGTYLNAGIPGTGIYDRKRIGNSVSSSSSGAQGESADRIDGPGLCVTVDDGGNSVVTYGDGSPVLDESLLRRLKRDESFREKVRELREQKRVEIEEATRAFTTMHEQAPGIEPDHAADTELAQLTARTHQVAQYSIPEPTEASVLAELSAEAMRTVRSVAFWRLQRLRREYVQAQSAHRLALARESWRAEKAVYDAEQAETKRLRDAEYRAEYERRKDALEKRIAGNSEYVSETVDRLLGELEMPLPLAVDYEYYPAAYELRVDLELPAIADLPDETARMLSSGRLSIRKKSTSDRNTEYARCVTGLAFYCAGVFYNVSPAIRTVVVSGYNNADDPVTGHSRPKYLYSVRFVRDQFAALKVAQVDPVAAIGAFEHRMSMAKDRVLAPVQPLGSPP